MWTNETEVDLFGTNALRNDLSGEYGGGAS